MSLLGTIVSTNKNTNYSGANPDNIRAILGLYRDNGKENGNYYSIIGYILGLCWDNNIPKGALNPIYNPNIL